MMQEIETGKEKVKKICDILRKETLEPAKQEASQYIEAAKKQADQIIKEASAEAEKLIHKARETMAREKDVFHASLKQACSQALETLRQAVEHKLFNHQLKHLISANTQDPKALANLITVVVKAIEKEGLDADLSVYIPSSLSAGAVNALLAKEILDKLNEKGVLLSSIGGGIEVRLKNENITIDISDEALKDLVADYIHKDFREMFFGS